MSERSYFHITRLLLVVYLLLASQQNVIAQYTIPYKKKELLFCDDFSQPLDTNTWRVEMTPAAASSVYTKNGQLIIDTKNGVTVWLNKKMEGNMLIEYRRTVVMKGGVNDRLSDLNQFWMANDPCNRQLFTRNGVFEAYDSLQLYYAGMGGNTNTTTRFRKYEGNGNKFLLREWLDKDHLLQANSTYRMQTAVLNGQTEFIVNGIPYFTWKDPAPLSSGYFGFRSTCSRQAVDEISIYRIE